MNTIKITHIIFIVLCICNVLQSKFDSMLFLTDEDDLAIIFDLQEEIYPLCDNDTECTYYDETTNDLKSDDQIKDDVSESTTQEESMVIAQLTEHNLENQKSTHTDGFDITLQTKTKKQSRLSKLFKKRS